MGLTWERADKPWGAAMGEWSWVAPSAGYLSTTSATPARENAPDLSPGNPMSYFARSYTCFGVAVLRPAIGRRRLSSGSGFGSRSR